MQKLKDLISKLKSEISDQLNLLDVTVGDIDDEEPLFGDKLGLDSIDVLELIVMLEKNYGIKIQNPRKGRKIFQTVKSTAEYIMKHSNA
jgi:acyl carrier protein